jgi:hypothetical protein
MRDYMQTFDFDARTVSVRGCNDTLNIVDDTYRLSASEVAKIRAELVSLTTTCSLACGNDYPNTTIAVVGATGAARSYQVNVYAACRGNTDLSPAFELFDYQSFSIRIATLLASCSNAPALDDAAANDASHAGADGSTTDGSSPDAADGAPRERVFTDAGTDAAPE